MKSTAGQSSRLLELLEDEERSSCLVREEALESDDVLLVEDSVGEETLLPLERELDWLVLELESVEPSIIEESLLKLLLLLELELRLKIDWVLSLEELLEDCEVEELEVILLAELPVETLLCELGEKLLCEVPVEALLNELGVLLERLLNEEVLDDSLVALV